MVLARHDPTEPGSPLHPSSPGNTFRPGAEGPHDLLVTERVGSSFHGTPDLDSWLRASDVEALVICGVTTTTNHCCETTARVGGNLGNRVPFALDETQTFDRRTDCPPPQQLTRALAAIEPTTPSG